jgi:hypothetical protein
LGISPASNDDTDDVARGDAVTGDASPKENTGRQVVDASSADFDGAGAEKSGAGGATDFAAAAAADAVFPNSIAGAGAVFFSLNASGSNCSTDGRVTGVGVGFECDAIGADTRFSADANAFAGVAL